MAGCKTETSKKTTGAAACVPQCPEQLSKKFLTVAALQPEPRGLGTILVIVRFAAMNKQTDACQRKAAECERHALIVSDLPAHKMYLELARMWREMAEHTERLETLQKRPH